MITTALLLPVLLGSTGMVMDVSGMFFFRTSLQSATDTAILTGASTLVRRGIKTTNDVLFIERHVKEILEFQLQHEFSKKIADEIASQAKVKVTKLSSKPHSSYSISVVSRYDMPLNNFSLIPIITGFKSIALYARGKTVTHHEIAVQPFSMQFVLDVSNSMGEPLEHGVLSIFFGSRMKALKKAAGCLIDDIRKKNISEEDIRMGVITFSHRLNSQMPIDWGTGRAANFIDALGVGGGLTNSTIAMQKAYDTLQSNHERQQHESRNHKNFKKYIIFMTDGMNTYTDDDTNTEKICLQAQQQGIEIFTISVGLEPFSAESDRVTRLMKICASSVNNYHNATHATGLMEAFQNIGKKMSHDAIILKN
ncbi:hypothetical protein RL73_04000 [Liberibacter crescens]|nr:hypothetical protein RL73_04000 [Liberibacter crescens]